MNTLISVDMSALFGHFKKPDMNDGLCLSYSYIHKPALLGTFGAIVGLGGYTQSYEKQQLNRPRRGQQQNRLLPEYFTVFGHLLISIGMTEESVGTFPKTIIGYNNAVGYANDGATLQVYEQTLIRPKYRVYVQLNLESPLERKLYDCLRNQECTYIPYMGKNDFSLSWSNFKEYTFESLKSTKNIRIDSLFIDEEEEVRNTSIDKTQGVALQLNSEGLLNKGSYLFMESLPTAYNSETGHYDLRRFICTNVELSIERTQPENKVFKIIDGSKSSIIQMW